MSEQIDYLDALMTLFIKSPHMSPSMKDKIRALQDSMRESKKSSGEVAIPVKVREISEEDMDSFEEE